MSSWQTMHLVCSLKVTKPFSFSFSLFCFLCCAYSSELRSIVSYNTGQRKGLKVFGLAQLLRAYLFVKMLPQGVFFSLQDSEKHLFFSSLVHWHCLPFQIYIEKYQLANQLFLCVTWTWCQQCVQAGNSEVQGLPWVRIKFTRLLIKLKAWDKTEQYFGSKRLNSTALLLALLKQWKTFRDQLTINQRND